MGSGVEPIPMVLRDRSGRLLERLASGKQNTGHAILGQLMGPSKNSASAIHVGRQGECTECVPVPTHGTRMGTMEPCHTINHPNSGVDHAKQNRWCLGMDEQFQTKDTWKVDSKHLAPWIDVYNGYI